MPRKGQGQDGTSPRVVEGVGGSRSPSSDALGGSEDRSPEGTPQGRPWTGRDRRLGLGWCTGPDSPRGEGTWWPEVRFGASGTQDRPLEGAQSETTGTGTPRRRNQP